MGTSKIFSLDAIINKSISVDVISNLPADVIDNILGCLPLRDAVRTSLLSREWRYRWTFIPELVFDREFERTASRNHKLERIIHQILLCHQGPINKFVLEALNYNHQGPKVKVFLEALRYKREALSYKCSPDIDHWLLLLSNCKVQDFSLHFDNWNKHVMPSHFFEFQHLRHLKLHGCVFKPPPQFQGFSNLITLDFQYVIFEPTIFEGFISRCMLLERVRLVGCTVRDSLDVKGPMFFTFDRIFKPTIINSSPVLAEVSSSSPIVDRREIQSYIKYLGFLPMLEKLHLRHLLKFLGAGGVPNRYSDSFNSLTVLDLSMCSDCVEEVACALCLVRSSPNLQKLRVTLWDDRNVGAVTDFIQAQETPDRYLNQLRRVEIEVFSGVESQMEFTRYLLASAGRLEEMVITPCCGDDGRLSLMNQLNKFPRASPSVLVSLRMR